MRYCTLVWEGRCSDRGIQTRNTCGYTVEWGLDREGFNFKLPMVKTCSTWPLLSKCKLQKYFEVGLQSPLSLSPQTPYTVNGKGQTLKIWILFLPWSKCTHSNLKGIIIIFKQNLDMIYKPRGRILSPKWLFLVKNSNFVTFGCCGDVKPSNFPLNVLVFPFKLIGKHFDHCKNKIQIFNFCIFHRSYKGAEVTVGYICSGGVKWNTFWPWPIWN